MRLSFKFFTLAAAFFVICCHAKAERPAAPTNFQHISNTTSSITWVWTDNSDNEQGFRCYEWYWDSVHNEYVLSNNPVWSVNANITSYTESGLAPNTQYRRVIVAWNTEGSASSNYAAVYTSIEPPAGLIFGPKGFDFLSKNARLTLKLALPLPSNLTGLPGSAANGFNYNNSAFYIEGLTTEKNIASTIFPDYGSCDPATPTDDGWWKYNSDYDPLPSMTGSNVGVIRWEHYLKNGAVVQSGTQWSCAHKWDYWCVEGLEPNTPYRFRAKSRNGDADETAWCATTDEIWTLPYDPQIDRDKDTNTCYNMGTTFTFTSTIPFDIGYTDHYHFRWTTNPYDIPSESDTKWSAGNWVIPENRGGDWYLVAISHNRMNETSGDYNYKGEFSQHFLSIGPFKVGYDVHGKVTISGGTGSYTDVVVHCGGNTTNCDSLGKFEFLHLPPGTYDIYPELPGYRIAYPVENAGHISVKIPDENDAPKYIKKNVDFTLAYKNTYTIAGKVTLAGGPGGVPSDVTRIQIGCGSYTPVNPDSKGNFYVPGVFAGTYKLRAILPEGDLDYSDYVCTFPPTVEYTVSVGPDATGKDFVFTWDETGEITAKILGKVNLIGGTGDPTKAVVYCKNLTTSIEGTANPDSAGKYSFSAMPKGNKYQLWVKMDGYRTINPADGNILVDNLDADTTVVPFDLVPINYYKISGRVDISEGIIRAPDTKVHCDCTSDTSISFELHPDNDGTYLFDKVPENQTYRIWLEIPQGYKITNPLSGRYDGISVGPDSTGNNFLVEPVSKYSLSGKITVAGGTCRPNEVLVVCSYYNSVKEEYVTITTIPDVSGNYKFTNLVPAKYSVSAQLKGYVTVYPGSGSHPVTITNKDITGKDFYLITYSIRGRIIFMGKSIEPVTNVTLICSAVSKNPDVPSVYMVIHPDSNGNYQFYNLLPSSKLADPNTGIPVPYRIEAKLEGHSIISPSSGYYDVIISNKDEQKDFYISAYTISGKITLYQGTADLTKAVVSAIRLKPDGTEDETIIVKPNNDGTYLISGIKTGYNYRVRTVLPGFYSLRPNEKTGSWPVVRVPPSSTDVNFLLMPKTDPVQFVCSISGKVTIISNDVTPDRVLVHCGKMTTYPDSYGNYIFQNLSPGTYDVWVERLGYHTTIPAAAGGHYYIVLDETNQNETGKDFTLVIDPVPVYKISGTITLIGGSASVTSAVVHCGNLTTNPNASGQYSFANLPAGSYELWVELPKYKTTNPGGSGKQTIKLYDRDVSGVDFVMQAIPTYSIKGTVTIDSGDVTQVKIVCSSGAIVNPDAFGRYAITELLAGNYQVYAEMPGYIVTDPKNNLYSVRLGPDAQNCDFVLTKTYTISGTVSLNGGTGNRSSVVIKCGNLTTNPGPTGYYEFTNLFPGTYEIYATLDGYTVINPASGKHTVTVGPDASLKDFTLMATTLLSVSGKVTILNGTGNVTDVVISAAGLSTNPDSNGNFTLSGLSPGTYQLSATLEDYTTVAPSGGSYRITLTRSNLANCNFSLATYSISGNVKVLGGADPSSVVITCTDGTTTSTASPDANGNYIFPQLPAGTYKLSASLPYFSTRIPGGDGTYTVKIGPSATGKNFTLVAYSISGKVSFYQTTGDLSSVSIRCTGPGIDITTNPDASGFYKISPLPAGNYEIVASLPGYTVVSPNGGKYTLTLRNDVSDKNFVITAFYISGKVSLMNSPSTPDKVTITLTGPIGTINTNPDHNGFYKFSILPAGSYTVSASLTNHTVVSPSGGAHNVTIPQNATGKDFAIVAYSISGTVRVNDIAGPAGTIIYCQGPAGTLQYTVGADGKFQFYPLPAGDYEVWAEKSGFRITYPAEGKYQFRLGSFATKNFVLQKM